MPCSNVIDRGENYVILPVECNFNCLTGLLAVTVTGWPADTGRTVQVLSVSGK